MDTGLQFGILGPLEVRAGGTLVHVGGPRQRALLALLLCHANQVVSRDQLIEELLAGQPAGAAAVRLLRVQISRLRQVLADNDGLPRVLARPPGYVLRVEPGELDLEVFEQRVAAGRDALSRGDPGRAAVLLGEAESLWRGRPLADLEFESFARFEIQRLQAQRLAAVEDRIEAELALGQHGALCPELEQLVAEHPLRERPRGQLMVALYRSGRQAEALETYRTGRVLLVEELGVEPGPGLRRVHEQVLAADPALDLPAPPGTAVLAGRPRPVVPRQLPADVAAFTGRAVELAELDFLLPADEPDPGAGMGAVVISAVAGTAGVGKTALAVRWAHRVAGQFPDGQLYVNLRGYDPGQPLAAGEALAGFLRALGVADADIPLAEAERSALYRSVVAGKRLLVVLDNAVTAVQVRPLLPGSASVMVVVTSRDSLAGLVARDGARRLDLDLLPQDEAVALLGALIGGRAEADHTAAEALAWQCARLPLALRVAAELAAARPGTPLAELVAELAGERNRLELLDAGGDPHAAVASVFSWSYRHLPPDAARVFRLLGLHPAQHWDPYAAAALTGTSLAQTRRLLGVLARAHLIQPAAPGRYQMHDLLRAYAASHDDHRAQQAALTRLFDYYLATSVAAANCRSPANRTWRPDPPPAATPAPELDDPAVAQAWLDAELPTLIRVAEHTTGHGWPDHTGRLSSALHEYVCVTGCFTDGIILAAYALDAACSTGDRAAQANALMRLGTYHSYQGRQQQGIDCARRAIAIARDLGDRLAQARAHVALALAQLFKGRHQHSARSLRQALALYRELGDQTGECNTLCTLGHTCLWQGRYRQAVSQLRQALAVAREARYRDVEPEALNYLGEAYCRLGQYQQATSYAQQALTTSREIGHRLGEAYALLTLGWIRHRLGQHDQAMSYQHQALGLHQELGVRHAQAAALTYAGETLLATGQCTQAHDRFTAALTLARQSGSQREQARALDRLGEVCHRQGHHDQATGYHQQALTLYQHIGDRGGHTEALNGTGETQLATGQHTQAHESFTAALTLARKTGDRYQQARAHRGLAAACQASGDTSQADQHWQHARDIHTGLGVPQTAHMHPSPAGAGIQPSPASTPVTTQADWPAHRHRTP